MSAPAMKDILLVGPGAVGALYSYIMKKSGLARVTAVARSNYDIIKSEGMTFRSKKYGEITGWRPDRLVKSLDEAADQPYSYVFVTTKAIPEVQRTPNILRPLLSTPYVDRFSQPTYVLVQNGLNIERDLYEAVLKLGKGSPRIISTSLWIGTNLVKPNIVEHGHFDRLAIGVYRPNDRSATTNTPEEQKILDGIGDILKSGGATLTVVPEMHRVKFVKNFWNIAFSSVSTLTRYSLPAVFRPPPSNSSLPYELYVEPATADLIERYTIPSLRATLQELVTLGRAMGFPDTKDGVPSSSPDESIATVRALYADPKSVHSPSMLLDVERDQPIEVEVIFGEVVRLAKEFNVPVPRVETLYGQLLVIQNQILRKRAIRNPKL